MTTHLFEFLRVYLRFPFPREVARSPEAIEEDRRLRRDLIVRTAITAAAAFVLYYALYSWVASLVDFPQWVPFVATSSTALGVVVLAFVIAVVRREIRGLRRAVNSSQTTTRPTA